MFRLISYVLVFIAGFAACTALYYAGPPRSGFHLANAGPALVASAPTSTPDSTAGPDTTAAQGTTIYAVANVEPSVVNIDITGRPVQTSNDEMGLPFGMPGDQGQPVVPKGVASGVIISSDGYILTNNHVAGEASAMKVTLHDGRRLPARVVGLDPQSDLAVIKVDATGLPAAKIGNSANVKVGQWVIAVGDPLGIGTTATAGIVSAIRSPMPIRDRIFPEIIQTDAAINPGNSGGALADLNGNIIGINTAIASTGGGSIGIGFTIPINLAMQHAKQLIEKHQVVYPWLGVVYLAQVDQAMPVQGTFVKEVTPNSPAAAAGIQPGDIITKVNNLPVDEPEKLNFFINQHEPGQTITITDWRQGRTSDIQIKLAERPANLQAPQSSEQPLPDQGDMGP